MKSNMDAAYSAARLILDKQMTAGERKTLDRISGSEVVVVCGCYDHVERVLQLIEVGHKVVDPADLPAIDLGGTRLLVVNCPGNLDRPSLETVRDFVSNGGTLFTTDWALPNVLEKAFPGYIEYNQCPTGDDVVGISLTADGEKLMGNIFPPQADPQWWLEGSSHPIRVLDSSVVRVVLESSQLAEKYGEAAIAVLFPFGKGEVIHMISHYYLQRTELRTDRHRSAWSTYTGEVGVGDLPGNDASFEGLAAGEVEAAHTSLQVLKNVLLRSSSSTTGQR